MLQAPTRNRPATTLESKLFLTEQKAELKSRYLGPTLDLLILWLDDFPQTEKIDFFTRLTSLVTQISSDYSAAQRKISIDKHNIRVDTILLNQIIEIMPRTVNETILGVYDVLFRLLHEYRFNKNPDGILPFLQIRQGGKLSARIQTNISRISEQLNNNKPCQVKELPSSAFENIVLTLLQEMISEKISKLENDLNGAPSQTVETSQKTDRAHLPLVAQQSLSSRFAALLTILEEKPQSTASSSPQGSTSLPALTLGQQLFSLLFAQNDETEHEQPDHPIPNTLSHFLGLMNGLPREGSDIAPVNSDQNRQHAINHSSAPHRSNPRPN